MIMALLVSALSLARERELGTFEQLLVTPLRPAEILIGKALPGIIVGLIDANIVIAAALLWFRLPFRGNLLLLEAMLLLYMLAGVGIGLVISSIRAHPAAGDAGRVRLCLADDRAVRLRGAGREHAAVVELISRADPMRYMLVIARGLFLQDMPPALALRAALPIVLIGCVTFGAAWYAVRRAVT